VCSRSTTTKTPVFFFFHRLWLRREAIDPLSIRIPWNEPRPSVFVTHFRVCVCVCVDKASIEGHDHVPRRLEWKREGKNIHRHTHTHTHTRKTGSFWVVPSARWVRGRLLGLSLLSMCIITRRPDGRRKEWWMGWGSKAIGPSQLD
jgi:hypothetical protein